MVGLQGNIAWKWMIGGYPYFRKPPYAPCMVRNYLHDWVIFRVNVGKYSSTMAHMGEEKGTYEITWIQDKTWVKMDRNPLYSAPRVMGFDSWPSMDPGDTVWAICIHLFSRGGSVSISIVSKVISQPLGVDCDCFSSSFYPVDFTAPRSRCPLLWWLHCCGGEF